MKEYRVWIYKSPTREGYRYFDRMADMVAFIKTLTTKEKWGIEKLDSTNDGYVDAFYSEDLICLFHCFVPPLTVISDNPPKIIPGLIGGE